VAGVTAASHVLRSRAGQTGKEGTVTGIDPATIGRFYHFKWQAGSLAALGDNGALVSDGYAKAHDGHRGQVAGR